MPKEKAVKICNYIIEYGILAIIFFIPPIFDFTGSSYNIVDLYKIVVFRVILTLMLLSYTAKIFISGKLSYRGSNKIFLLVALLALAFFVGSLFSIQPNQSFWGDFFRQQGFYNFFNYLLFFVLLILNIKDFKQIKRIIIVAVGSASLTAIYGLIQYFNLDPVAWSEKATELSRIYSTLGQPNWFGHYLILVLPLGLYALLFIAKGFLARFFVGLVILLQLFCLTFTYSRAAWLGFIGSIIFLLLVWLWSERLKKLAFGFMALLLIGLMMIVGLSFIKPVDQNHLTNINLINRLKSLVDFNGGSGKMRLYFLESAVKEITKASPGRLLVGFGPETLANVFIKYYQPDWGIYEAINGYPDRAHNWLFDKILALGIFGLMANLAFYIYLTYKAAAFLLTRPKLEPDSWLLIFLFSSLVAYCVNNLFSFSLFTVSVYLYLVLAIVWSLINFKEKVREVNIKLTDFSKLLIWLALLAVLAIFIYTNNINQVRAEIYYVKALKSMNIPDCQGVMDNLEKVISLSPNSAYYQKNYLFLMLNCFASIQDSVVQAQLLNSMLERVKLIDDEKAYEVLQNTARAYTLFGFYLDKAYYKKAEDIYQDLIKDYPYLVLTYEDLGRQRMMRANYRGAIDIYKRALAILPPTDSPYLNAPHRAQVVSIAVRMYEGLGQAHFKIKNYDSALDYYKKGLALDPFRATLYKNIADIYYAQSRLVEAIAWNKRGMMLNPGDYNWPLALSLLYRDKKDLIKAKEYLDQALRLAPENNELKKYYQELNK